MRGRKPTPGPLKIAAGGRAKARSREPQARGPIGTAPKWLDRLAKIEWRRIIKALGDTGVLTAADRATLAAYCQAYARWKQAEALVNADGLVIRQQYADRDLLVRNPATAILNESRQAVLRFAAELGLTPIARARIRTPEKRENNRFEDFLNRGTAS